MFDIGFEDVKEKMETAQKYIGDKKIKLELHESEFNMIIDKLCWMRCVVRDSDLDYTKYCNGECGNKCNRPDLCNFEKWFRSKIVNC